MPPRESFIGAFGRIASTVLGASPEAPRQIWGTLAPWVQGLVQNATKRWLPLLALNIPCEVIARDPATGVGSACQHPAIAACGVCRRPTCLHHSLVNIAGDAICFVCAQAAVDAHRGAAPADVPPPNPGKNPRPGPAEVPIDVRFARARKVLGVKQSATWAEIERAYKALLKKHHPDCNPKNRAHAEERFKAVRVAYDLLKQAYPESTS